MREWWEQLDQREQLSLFVLTLCLSMYLLFVALWRPVHQLRDDMAARNVSVSAALGRVEAMAGELKQLKAGGSQRKRNLNSLINTSTASHELEVSRIQPNTRGEVQVRFEDVSFSNLMRWMYQLEQAEGLNFKEVSISQTNRGGLVNATVRLAQGA